MALRLLIAILILAVPAELPGCGPNLPVALFHYTGYPEAPADFAHGQLGILPPTYERLYQVMAYRWLSGVGLNAAEQKAVLPDPEPVTDAPAASTNPNPWLAARNSVAGVKPVAYLDPYRPVKQEGFFGTYLNCYEDAFRTAAVTLKRVQQSGSAVDWIAAQDVVFSDCAKGDAIPAPSTDPRLRADRAYQIASAEFYSEKYESARQRFQAIAADASSPWHDRGAYLAARCLIRAGKPADAESELQKIADDPAQARWHASAKALLNYVRTRQHPAERMHELALALVRPNSQATIGQDLTDYRLLFDKDVKPQIDDDLTDWIRSFQAYGAGAFDQWHARHTLPWLIAALQAAKPRDAAVPELLAAARELKPDSPGFATAHYHMVRLLPAAEARAEAEKLLSANPPASVRNQIRAQRMALAANFDEFLRYAARAAVGEQSFDITPAKGGPELLDSDSVLILNRDIPLALLKQAAASPMLPAAARSELTNVIAVRTLVLSPSPDFDSVFKLLNAPGMAPYLEWGLGRFTKELAKIDPLRDNWWCGENAANLAVNPSSTPLAANGAYLAVSPSSTPAGEARAQGAAFLSAGEREQAAAEWKSLQALPTGPNWLAAQTLAFAQSHPADPRIAEALYLVVRSTRYGCTDAATSGFSHRTFDLLHRKYPNSEWAKKTPYWFQ
jgi:Tetratricopeptide repeat